MRILGGIKTTVEDKAEKLRQLQTSQVAQKYAPDWMAETEILTGEPCTSWEQIAWDNPEISLQLWLCDPVHVRHIKNKKTRAKALACLTEEQLAVYYERRDGYSYSDLEKKGWKASIMSSVMHLKHKNKAKGEETVEESLPSDLPEDEES